jgi:adenylate cyclase
MTIRKKFFLLAAILLALFALVVGISAATQQSDHNQLANINMYELPLMQLVGEFDVDTDRYELEILRALRLDENDVPGRQEAIASAKALANQLRATVRTGGTLLRKAIDDPSYQTEERIELARAGAALRYISRYLDEFIALGEATLAKLEDGQAEQARRTSFGFAKFSQAFGPDLSEIRRKLGDLSGRSTRAVLARQQLNILLSFALFVAACGVGLSISAVGSTRVVAGLRQLVVSAKALEAGAAVTPVTVRTRDEVGELALAFNRMIDELQERDRVKETFGKFIDPRLVSRLIATGADQAERRSLTVFFSDIKHFTGISEQLTANAVVHLLNNYFGDVADVIHKHRGIIDKYIGDAVMAFWVPPFSTGDDHTIDACCAALAQQQAIAALRERIPEITGMRRNAPEIVIRMGIATGEAVVGTIGSASSRSYTVIGDTVNLASRLESINKVYGTLILISEETYRLAQTAVEVREVDLITVAGKSEAVRIYELMALAGELEPEKSQLRDVFAEGLAAYRLQDWGAAEARFEECLRIAPDDGPAQLLAQRICKLKAAPPPESWDGVWRHVEK